MHSPAWAQQQERFQDFVAKYQDRPVVQLELGIGAANKLIKDPMMRTVAMHNNWSFITLNLPQEINILPLIQEQSLALLGDLKTTLA